MKNKLLLVVAFTTLLFACKESTEVASPTSKQPNSSINSIQNEEEPMSWILTQAQRDSLYLYTYSGNDIYRFIDTAETTRFNPVLNCDGEWCIFEGEVDFCDVPDLQWVKTLPTKEWCWPE